MGIAILELVLQTLHDVGFCADVAYPGQKYPAITEPVAAVHIEKADGTSREVTVEVIILAPSSTGGTVCEQQALLATEALIEQGAKCVQGGCVYNAAAQVYMVPIHVTFAGTASSDDSTIGPGFQVYINNVLQPHAVSFTYQKEADHKVVYSIGVTLPEVSTAGRYLHTFSLEEQIPVGSAATAEPTEPFSLRVETETTIERYFVCRWTSIQQEHTKEGLRRIRTGFSRIREEIANE